MEPAIDCLFIGHNEMDFAEYEKSIRKMGANSGAYRDLNLGFIKNNNKGYHASAMFNFLCSQEKAADIPLKPLYQNHILGAAIVYLSTYLNRRGLTFDYINGFQEEKQELANKLKQKNILTVAVTTTLYVSVLPILEIIGFIKKYNSTAKIIVGGPFISTQFRCIGPERIEYLFETMGADFYVNSSQGEAALVQIINSLKTNSPLHKIKNIYYRANNRFMATPVDKEDNQLSQNMVDWNLFRDRIGEYVNVRTSISCPFSCAFCGFPQHAGKYQTAELEAVEKELKTLDKIESVKFIHFIDDTFNIPKKRFKDLLGRMIKNHTKFKWTCHLRCQFVDREMVELMKESGCAGVFLGLESGNNQILKNMNKAARVEDYRQGIALLKEYSIITYGSFIIGFPGETQDTVMDTVKLIEESELDFYRTQLWYYEAITPIAKEKERYGIKGSNFEWSHKTMNSKEAADLIDNIFLSIDKSLWLPQYNFDFVNIFHLTNQDLPLERVKNFIRVFNNGIKEKLIDPSRDETSANILKQLRACLSQNKNTPSETREWPEADDINIDFNLGLE